LHHEPGRRSLLPTAAALAICPLLVEAIWRDSRIVPSARPAAADDDHHGFRDSFTLIWDHRT
jgi:hypothetical protein